MNIVAVNGVELAYETFGHPNDPVVLLVAGQSSSMDSWDIDFCEQLAGGGRYVIRYDARDTGQSTSYPADSVPPYSLADLGEDVVALLAELDHQAAHLVGVSQGGALVSYVAVQHPERVRSLTLIATGPGAPGSEGLPAMSDRLRNYFSNHTTDVSSRAGYVEHVLDSQIALAGAAGVDPARVRAMAGAEYDRTPDVRSAFNHQRMGAAPNLRAKLRSITAPTLVVQGADDELFAAGHSAALVDEIPGAELLTLDHMGHQVPPPATWPVLVPALLKHTSGGWDAEAGRLATRGRAAGDPPTAWFDRLYQAGDEGRVDLPWNRSGPHDLLVEWLAGEAGRGRSAVVVGCGLGADAEYLAGLGWDTLGFDVSPHAIRLAGQRHPGSRVKYRAASLFELPSAWRHVFDLVVEIFTVQSLPRTVRAEATAAVSSLVAPGGRLLVISGIDGAWPVAKDEPPWPLTEPELAAFAQDGLSAVQLGRVGPDGRPRWRGVFRR